VRTPRRAAAVLSVLALTGALAACSDEPANEAPPPAEDPGIGEGDPLQPGEIAPSG
jgi:hypothetical protein